MCLVFVAAEKREFSGVLRHASEIRKLSWPLDWARAGRLNGRTAVFVANGPGPELAATAAEQAVSRLEKVEALISTGFCGALADGLNVGDVFIATAVNGVETSAPVRLREHDIRKHETGLLVSQDRVACTIEEKRNLCRTGASAVEMEAAGVSRAARKAGVPFYCVRVVTDGAAEPFPLDFNRMRDASGRFSRTRIVLAACRQPLRIFPELVKLDKTCKRASVALGDFLANCRF